MCYRKKFTGKIRPRSDISIIRDNSSKYSKYISSTHQIIKEKRTNISTNSKSNSEESAFG